MNIYKLSKASFVIFNLLLIFPIKTNVIWFPPTPAEVAAAQNNVIWNQAAADQSTISWLYLAQEIHEQRKQQQKVNEYLSALQKLAFVPGKIAGVSTLDLSMLEYEEEQIKKTEEKNKVKHAKKRRRRT